VSHFGILFSYFGENSLQNPLQKREEGWEIGHGLRQNKSQWTTHWLLQ
jgi:hypothetical protein